MNTQAVVDLTQSLGWIINQEKSELKLTQERWLKLHDPGFDPTSQVKMCFDCKMFDVSN